MTPLHGGALAKARALFAAGLLLVLAACGGGSGTGASSSIPASGAVANATLTGTAATGGPISGTVTLKDASAAAKIRSGTTASDGSFSFDVTGLTAPFVLRVTYGDAAAPSALYSLATGPGNANITPLTTIAARAAIGGGDLGAFFNDGLPAEIARAGSRMSNAVASLQNAIAPLLQRFNVQGDLLSTPFTADHTGVDAMMDAIAVGFAGSQVTVSARSSGALLFSAPPDNLGAGSFNSANLAQMPAMAPTAGGSLYTLYCAGCHGALSASTKRGITAAALQAAIANDLGGMGSLAALSAAETQSIVTALSSQTISPTPPSSPPDGAALYASKCAGCHGPLSTSTKLGATSVRIQNAISGNTGAMGILSSLTAADIQAIAVALAVPTPTPSPTPGGTTPDGAALYAAKCAGCHGPLATSTKQGISIARLQAAIGGNAGGMGSLSTLSVTEVQAIVTALTPTTPTPTPTPPPTPPDGAALYGSSCAGCHGALSATTKAGATVTRIQNAIAGNTGGMGFLSTLSATDVQAIAAALASASPPPPPPPTTLDGPTLYGQSCAGCHGALANSTKGGATVTRIQTAIAANAGGMGSLSTLTTAQITSISSALAAIAPTTGACGSCHAIPPATGRHAKHASFSCANCHGVGYSASTVNATTHNNGAINLASATGWVASTKTCSNGCHGKESWLGSRDD